MTSRSVVVALPEPDWLEGHSEPNIDDLVAQLGDDARRLYRRYLADEVRAGRPAGLLPAWRAFDRTICEIQRLNSGGRRM